MGKIDSNNYGYEDNDESKSLKDYLLLIRNNLLPFISIILVFTAGAVYYALNKMDIYESNTVLKISKPQGNILEAPLTPDIMDYGMDRFIANEIEIIKSYTNRERVAEALIDSFKTSNNKDKFYLALTHEPGEKSHLLSVGSFVGLLNNMVSVEQKRGLDIINITAESPSPYEAALIANCYAQQYRNLNLEVNRNQLTFVKNFLGKQKAEKQKELDIAEDSLRNFQERGGIIALDEQASTLIDQLSQFEAKMNAAKIDYMASSNILHQYKTELKKQDPRMANYLESLTSEAYITALQKQLAELQLNKDLAMTNSNNKIDVTAKIKEYDQKISELKSKLNDKIEVIKAGIFASSPAEVKELSQKIIEEDVKNSSLSTTIKGLSEIVDSYEKKFNKLPKTSIELARLQRHREFLEKLYSLVENKYQEAVINEQSQPGNVLIVDKARIPVNPAKPNRRLIVLIGLILGIGLAFGYVMIKDYFDDTIKTPEDIQKKNINVLAWIPRIEGLNTTGKIEFVVANKPKSIPSEAFKALRTRVQFSNIDVDSFKTILITSAAPQEGKTIISLNLAGSFAQSDKNVVLIDCDFRKPRMHRIFGVNKNPGLVNYLFNQASLDEIIWRPDLLENFSYITSGTIPPNPAEVLQSKAMHNFLDMMRSQFDVIILDAPPIISVTDSEILSRMVDGSILIVSAEKTEAEMMKHAVELMKNDRSPFLGVVLNNFVYKNGYSSYYKYYYYYSHTSNGNGLKPSKIKS